MSKTLEELGYEKEENYYLVTFKKRDKAIVFDKSDNTFYSYIQINDLIMKTCLGMEELKAIYKWCEDNKWI